MDEYRKVILGFIFKIKNALEDLEHVRKGITNEILVLDLITNLENEATFLDQKIRAGISKYSVELDKNDGIENLRNNKLLVDFLGIQNIKQLKEDL